MTMTTTRTILFTWEIGQGLGHVMPLLPVARQLKEAGHRVLFALRDVRTAGPLLAKEGFAVLQAPVHPDRFFPARGPQPQTMADILEIFGFGDPHHLAGLAMAWKNLMALCSPDVVVASYAPLSLNCARKLGIPTLLLALPFELPLDRHPLPNLRDSTKAVDGRADERIVKSVNSVFGAGHADRAYDLFRSAKTIMMSFPELDYWGPRPSVEYCGNLFVTDAGVLPVWPEGPGPRVFTYLQAALPQLDELRQVFHSAPQNFCIYMREGSPELLEKWSAPNIHVTNRPLRLDAALTDCAATVNYGGAGFVSASLLAGKPMLMMPRDLEPTLTARRVAAMGAGIHVSRGVEVGDALRKVLDTTAYTDAARKFAAKRRAWTPRNAAEQIADAVIHSS
jgi:UDP:flavonoid glycosyltransferase YjiC (YdhE family)